MTGHVEQNIKRRGRRLASMCASGLALLGAPAGHAEPDDTGSPTSPFPVTNLILNHYEKVRYDDYFTSSSGGVWFTAPLGLNCGIWDRGSFGCTGDIRGAPPGTHNIGWITGQIEPRYDLALGAQIPPGRGERELSPRSFIEYNGTRCATMADTSTYCQRGPFRFFVTPTRTWLAPP